MIAKSKGTTLPLPLSELLIIEKSESFEECFVLTS